MSPQLEDLVGQPRRRLSTAWVVLIVSLAITALAALTAVGLQIYLAATGRQSLGVTIGVGIAGTLMFAAAACGLLWAALNVNGALARLTEQASTLEQQSAIIAEQTIARGQALAADRHPLAETAEMRNLLREIREILLLPESERQRRFEHWVDNELHRGVASAELYIMSRDFHRARAELEALAERFGESERLAQARQHLEKASENARASDLNDAVKRIQELVSLVRWEEAEQVARELAAKYPHSAEATALLARVRRERTIFEQQHRQRMHDEIQNFVHQRQWRQALEAARRFIQTFPNAPDLNVLREQMETLQANAEIQTRQELERDIKEHIRQRRYWDALNLSRRIIAEFPLSPQANVLRAQIPRLEELARQQEQEPAAV